MPSFAAPSICLLRLSNAFLWYLFKKENYVYINQSLFYLPKNSQMGKEYNYKLDETQIVTAGNVSPLTYRITNSMMKTKGSNPGKFR